MRHFITSLLICLLIFPCSAQASPKKKDYRLIPVNNVFRVEKSLPSQNTKTEKLKKRQLRNELSALLAQKKYKEAIVALEKSQKYKSLSTSENVLLAFLYFQIGNCSKALQIIEQQLQNNPNNRELLNLAKAYSAAEKNWNKAIGYTDELLRNEPDSEELLRNSGDICVMKKDVYNAIKFYERLTEIYPITSYKVTLANLYMSNGNCCKAEKILEPMYKADPNNKEIINALLSSLLSQQKFRRACCIIKERHMEQTKEGYMVFADMAMSDGEYDTAAKNYFMALKLDGENLTLKNKLAQSYRLLGLINSPTRLYKEVLAEDPNNAQAKLGLGYVEIDKKNFQKARKIFKDILAQIPDCKAVNKGIVHSYISNGEALRALELLDQMPQEEDVRLIKAQIYYKLGMYTSAKEVLPCRSDAKVSTEIPVISSEEKSRSFKSELDESELRVIPEIPQHESSTNTESTPILRAEIYENAQSLRTRIKKDEAIVFTPSYSFVFQQLAQEFKLDLHKFGLTAAKRVDENTNVFGEYNIIIYSSGDLNQQNNVVNEFRGGVQARPTEKFEYRGDFGVKSFEFGNGAMLLCDSWIKYYYSDKFNLKLGFKRNNIEQSYLSAVGRPVDGVFTGRAADNKLYLDFERRLPYKLYSFGRGSFGTINAQNLITNQYLEAIFGVGRVLYDNPRNKWINTFAADIVSYNSGYKYNLLNIFNSAGVLFGGYFSPQFFDATTANLKIEGQIRKWHLKWGLKGFAGIQTAMTPDQTNQAWGFSPYATYEINDHVSVNVAYNYYRYAGVRRDQFMISAVIRGFRSHDKK